MQNAVNNVIRRRLRTNLHQTPANDVDHAYLYFLGYSRIHWSRKFLHALTYWWIEVRFIGFRSGKFLQAWIGQSGRPGQFGLGWFGVRLNFWHRYNFTKMPD